jgi:glutamate-1-semialdehyde 2,1-aminomutase
MRMREFSLERSQEVFDQIRKSIAGGESSYVRIMDGHLTTVLTHGRGSRMWDVDGNEYIDYNLAYGPLFFGHVPSRVTEAVIEQISERGADFGFPFELAARTGELMQKLVPGLDLVRFANSGTEAVASALRLARAATGKDKIVRFEGHYHGWSEAIFTREHLPPSALGLEATPFVLPGSTGMPEGALADVIVQSWNRADLLEDLLSRRGHEVAAVIMEPINFNSGAMLPEPGYLEYVRDLTREHGVLLIFDEVITGFRVGPGGASRLFGVTPDIWTFAKALGAGFPVAAFGGTAEVMDLEARNEVFHGGTYAGSPLALAAAEAVLSEIHERGDDLYGPLFARSERLGRGLETIISGYGFPCVWQGVGPAFQIFFTHEPVEKLRNYREAAGKCLPSLFTQWQHSMQRHGVYFHPSQWECFFVSTAHTDADIDVTLEAADAATATLLASAGSVASFPEET